MMQGAGWMVQRNIQHSDGCHPEPARIAAQNAAGGLVEGSPGWYDTLEWRSFDSAQDDKRKEMQVDRLAAC